MLEALWSAREKWFYIGLKLGIKPDKLEDIKKENQTLDNRFTSMVIEWLGKKDATRTWTVITEVLKSRMVGFVALADELLRKQAK